MNVPMTAAVPVVRPPLRGVTRTSGEGVLACYSAANYSAKKYSAANSSAARGSAAKALHCGESATAVTGRIGAVPLR